MNHELARDYLKAPYSRILIPDEEGYFSAEILEFPGCFAEGSTPTEAIENLEAVAESWIEAALDQGQTIPEPWNNQGYSGKIALRLPRSLHRQAAKLAIRDGVSLNQFLVAAIAMRLGAEEFVSYLADRFSRSRGGTQYQITLILNNPTIASTKRANTVPGTLRPFSLPMPELQRIDSTTEHKHA